LYNSVKEIIDIEVEDSKVYFIVEFEDIKDSELKLKIYEIAFRIKREFRISKEEFEKALE
jgi:hypothetical protein